MNFHTILEIVALSLTIAMPFLLCYVKIEKRLTRIETLLEMLIGASPGCQQFLDKGI
jgi:hypothetical protein